MSEHDSAVNLKIARTPTFLHSIILDSKVEKSKGIKSDELKTLGFFFVLLEN